MIPIDPSYKFDVTTGDIMPMSSKPDGTLLQQRRSLGDVAAIFADQPALARMDLDQTAYRVDVWMPAAEGTPDALQVGTSFLSPGLVGDEYFMTKGHYHARRERPEVYWGIGGAGLLLLQDEDGRCRAERVFPGSLHHIFGHVAHRLVNTGTEVLTVGACWPLDAGHDYGALADTGFAYRVLKRDGAAQLVPATPAP